MSPVTADAVVELPRLGKVCLVARQMRRCLSLYQECVEGQPAFVVPFLNATRFLDAVASDALDDRSVFDPDGETIAAHVEERVTYHSQRIQHLVGTHGEIQRSRTDHDYDVAQLTNQLLCGMEVALRTAGNYGDAASHVMECEETMRWAIEQYLLHDTEQIENYTNAITQDSETIARRAETNSDYRCDPSSIGRLWPNVRPCRWPDSLESEVDWGIDSVWVEERIADLCRVSSSLKAGMRRAGRDMEGIRRAEWVETQSSLISSLDEDLAAVAAKVEVIKQATSGFADNLNKLSDDTNGKLEQIVNDCTASTTTLTEENSSRISEHEAKLHQLVKDADRRLRGLEESLHTEVVSKAPVTFWQESSEYHRKQFRIWGTVLIVTTLLMIVGVFTGWYVLFGNDNGFNVWRIGVSVFTATLALLLVRFLGRIALSHLHLRSDGSLRVVMVQVYLALAREGALNETHRHLILQALFRTPSTGLIKDDSNSSSVIDLGSRLAQSAVARDSS